MLLTFYMFINNSGVDFHMIVDIEKLSGVMEFWLEPGTHRIQVQFTDTPVRNVGEWLSLFSLASILATPWLINRLRSRGVPFPKILNLA